MQRKLIKVGTSAAVLIPKAMLEDQKLKIGDFIHVEVFKTAPVSAKTVVDPEVLAWTDKLIKRYRPLLKKLASS